MDDHDCSAMLDCPECETPAIPASSVANGRPVWTEDDAEVWCPGCGCLLHVFLTGDYQGSQWCEARVSEYSGRDWRRAIEDALGVDEVPDEHTPDFLAEAVLAQREIGNQVHARASKAERELEALRNTDFARQNVELRAELRRYIARVMEYDRRMAAIRKEVR